VRAVHLFYTLTFILIKTTMTHTERFSFRTEAPFAIKFASPTSSSTTYNHINTNNYASSTVYAPISRIFRERGDGQGENTRVGESKEKVALSQHTTLPGSPSKWKTAGNLASLSTSTRNEEPSSLTCEDEGSKRKDEMEGFLEEPKNKKKSPQQESSDSE
jgi:hypothetical protein